MNRASSRVEVGNSGILSISDLDHRVSSELEQESQASTCVEWNSACLSSCSRGDRPLVELYLEPAAFSGRCNWGVSSPSCCDFILMFTFEEVPGHQNLSLVNREIGVFWNVARPTRIPIEFQYETCLLLRCNGKVGIPFQTKQGNRPSCQDEEGRRGSD